MSDTAFRTLAGVRVEVLNGPDAGLITTSDRDGQFSLNGTFDDSSRFQATADGHAPSVLPLDPICDRCNPNRWVHFQLEVLEAPVNIAGRFEMTLTLDRKCSMFPDEIASRAYDPNIPAASASGAAANA